MNYALLLVPVKLSAERQVKSGTPTLYFKT
jgi:hypothetical protein